MRRKILGLLLALTAWAYCVPAFGQDVHMFWQVAPSGGFSQWGPVSATNPLPVTTSGTTGADPCQTNTATTTPISITTATTTRIVAPTASKKTYVCYMLITSAAADNVAIVEGTGGTCGSGTAGVVGGTTATNGLNFAANGGAAFGSGASAVFWTAGTNVDLCLITSANTPLAGTVKWVQAP